jgi:glycosyltransferase involved in cell wall biosynthesis
MDWRGLRVAIIGPLPPPAGGMGDQVMQLAEQMRGEGADVRVVRTNPPNPLRWVAATPGVRTLARLPVYLRDLWRAAGSADLLHIMANSGWSWHLLVAPAVWTARMRAVPSVVSYHGGQAEAFLARSIRLVAPTLRAASALIVPSAFLQRVFGLHGIESRVVPNVVDLSLFRPGTAGQRDAPHLVVVRNLEPLYDIPTALRAFAAIRERIPRARLTVAGSGSEHGMLCDLADELGIRPAVDFAGRLSRTEMAALLARADLMLNPSTADNMPVSILEAMASGVPVVSTRVGGIPFLLDDGRTGLLVEARDPAAMAAAALRLLEDAALAQGLRAAAAAEVRLYAWPRVRALLEAVYESAMRDASRNPA